MRKVQAGKLTKGDKLVPVDHAAIDYAPFRCARFDVLRRLCMHAAAGCAGGLGSLSCTGVPATAAYEVWRAVDCFHEPIFWLLICADLLAASGARQSRL